MVNAREIWFKCKPLPKPEYLLLKRLKQHFRLKDDSEAVAVAIKCLYELLRFDNGIGEVIIINTIGNLRGTTEDEREYDV